jgi:hypothetical protein
MVEDVTKDLSEAVATQLQEAALVISQVFKFSSGRSLSGVMSECSENLVAAYVGGRRMPNHVEGYDVLAGEEKIEVKARFWRHYGPLQFDISRHSLNASSVYFFVWVLPGETVHSHIHRVFRMGASDLFRRFGTPNGARVSFRGLEKLVRT